MSNVSCVQGFLPVQPHLLAYLQWKEGLAKGEYFQIPSQSPHAIVLSGYINLACSLIPDAKKVPEKALKMDRFTGRLPFQVKGLNEPDFFLVAAQIALQFDSYLYHAMQEELLTRVLIGMRFGMKEKTTIEEFLEETELNYYVNVDSFKRAQTRLRHERKVPILKGRLQREYYSKFA